LSQQDTIANLDAREKSIDEKLAELTRRTELLTELLKGIKK
jgi:hypothetical protein